ncbi:FHA domain-containing protein [Aphelenchoides fujianensis]|nr:FHA domain-containing protein [Aphelenchoides fujianensis]
MSSRGPSECSRGHALVEYHPLTRSFWLRDLQSGQHGGALGYTTRNSRPIYGMVELKSGDTLQFGDSAEFIFEMPALPASKMERSSRSKRRTQTSSSTDRSTDRESTLRERFVRPAGIGNHRLCHLRNVPRLVDTGKSLSIAAEAKPAAPNRSPVRRSASVNDRNNNEPKKRKPRAAEPAVVPPPSSTPSSERDSNRVERWSDLGEHPMKSAGGSQLVQRIVRLQNELQRRELEMRQLRERLAARENPPLPKINGGTPAPSAQQPPGQPDRRDFFSVSSRELEELGRRIGTTSMRDYGDVFNECYRMLQEPFACRLMEINTKCGHIFERMPISTDDRELLYERFDNFFRDRINPISKSLDAFLPVLKDGLFLARQDVRACSLFSTWSREFADPTSASTAMGPVDDLQVRFAEHSLKAHWLPPSLAPLLKILVYEYRNICDEMARKDKEHALSVRRLTDQVAALEMQVDQQQQRLEAQNPRIVADDSAEQEELHFLRDENSTLRTANGSPPAASGRSACGPRTPLDATDDEKPKRPSAPSESDSCSQPSTEEIIEDPDELEEEETDNEYEEEDDEKKEARAPSPPRLEEEHAVRRMEQEETNELELKPPPDSSPEEAETEAKIDRHGACESKGIRDARGPPDDGDREPPPPPAEDDPPAGGDGGGRQKREAGGEDDGGSDDEREESRRCPILKTRQSKRTKSSRRTEESPEK